jgi:hypothetical protein
VFGVPAVEAEGELVQVVVELVGASSALVRPQHPSFQQGSRAVHPRKADVGRVAARSNRSPFVDEAVSGEPVVAQPSIRSDRRAGLDHVLAKRSERVRAGIGCAGKAYSTGALASNLAGDDYDALVSAAATCARINAANEGLVHLDDATEAVSSGPHHRSAELVQHRPGRLVGAKTESVLQPQRANALLLARQMPRPLEPDRHRQMRPLKQRPRRQGELAPALRTAPAPVAQPPASARLAVRTADSLRPAHLRQVIETGFLGSEPLVQLPKRPRIVLPCNWTSTVSTHSTMIRPSRSPNKWIPHWAKYGATEDVAMRRFEAAIRPGAEPPLEA